MLSIQQQTKRTFLLKKIENNRTRLFNVSEFQPIKYWLDDNNINYKFSENNLGLTENHIFSIRLVVTSTAAAVHFKMVWG